MDTSQPIAVDLCCGLGGWTEGLLAEGWRVVGFDIVRPKSFPAGALFVQQDIATISARSWRGYVDLVVASPPCTEFSQVWNFNKTRRPDPATAMDLIRHCFRIGAECGAPFILENVRGAREHLVSEFGPPSWKCGSFYFWGDGPFLKPKGRFQKGIWNCKPAKDGSSVWKTRNLQASYVRDPAERARIPIEISRAVGNQLFPATASRIAALSAR